MLPVASMHEDVGCFVLLHTSTLDRLWLLHYVKHMLVCCEQTAVEMELLWMQKELAVLLSP